jgi:ABC-type phosphate transport system substrate-binding protein
MAARGLFASLCLCICGWAASAAARADIYVVVNADNPQRALSHKEVIDLFMGRGRSFSNGELALAFDLPRNHAVREAFYTSLTGMSASQRNSYWARLMFTGQTMPPQTLPAEPEVLKIVRRNPSAIGYVSQEPADKGLRTVFVLKESH